MNDEEEDESAMGAVRYPCMPSLVSLQQMRNRLHLAYLGRKLMKWTGLATGRELRKIAMAIDLVYKTFAEDIRNAFILLARGRYFCPVMNEMVLENVADTAYVTVGTRSKALTGVKVIQYDVFEGDVEPYEHLGIENGGQPIHEAKMAWLELIKRLVLMLELRISFVMVEEAHKSATKRKNVLTKTVLPRVMVTISYILTELQEQEREERFRIKRIKEKKQQKHDRDKNVNQKVKKKTKAHSPICCSPNPSVTSHTSRNTPLAADRNNKEDMKRLEHLLSHIDDVVQRLAKQEGISSKSTKEFIENCSKFRGTLKSSNAKLPCDSEYDNTVYEEDSEQEENEEDNTEVKTEEFVKVTKHRNRDGTFTEEVQTTTIKTERKTPSTPHMPVNMDNVRETKSEYHKHCYATDDDNRRTLSASQSKADVCPKKCSSSRNKTENRDTGCLVCSSHEQTSLNSRKQGSTEAIWRDAWTSSTDLDVMPSKLPSALKRSNKSRTDQSTCAIKIIAKPPPPVVLSLRKKYDADSTCTSAHSKCMTCNYSSKNKGSDSSVCESCNGKSSKSSKSKRGVSDSSYCQKCQSAQAKAADSKVNKNNCPQCEKTKKITPKHTCPMCRTPSINSSMSQLQGIVSLSAKTTKCLICGNEKTQEVKKDGNEPKCSILSFIKSKLLADRAKGISCPCCGANDTEKTKSNMYRSSDPSVIKYTKSSEEVCCSMSNKSFGVERASREESEKSDENVGVGCSTQTARTMNSKPDDYDCKTGRCTGGCTGEAVEPPDCKSCIQMKDAAANTKAADRYDVRPLNMLPSRVSNTCKLRQRVCNCQSMPNMNRKPKPLRRTTSFQF